MKLITTIISTVLAVFTATISAHAQSMEADKNVVIESCDTYLYDDGGEANNYSANFKGSLTIKPDVPGKVIEFTYEEFDLSFYANWNVYNGSIDDALIFTEEDPYVTTGNYFYGNPDENGSITLELDASEAPAAYTGEGFKIKVSCVDAYPNIDLSIPSYGVSDTIVAGDAILADFTYRVVDNDLNKDISSYYKVNFYLSDDKNISVDDAILKTEYSASTNSSNLAQTLYTESNLNEGRRYVLAKIDDNEAIPETDETNNIAIDSVYIKESNPDLEVVNVELTKDTIDPTNSESLEWTAYTRNNGNQRIFTYSSYYISTDSIIPTSTQGGSGFGGTAHYYEIGETDTDEGEVNSWNLESYTKGEKYYLIIHADDYGDYQTEYDLDGKYLENDEENNWYIKPFWIYGEKDNSYKMPMTGTDVLISCDTIISDAGGVNGDTKKDYNAGILVLKPSSNNMKIKLEFTTFNYGSFDEFYVFNQEDDNTQDYYTLTTLPSEPIIADNAEGALTLQANAFSNFSPVEGFVAKVTCETITSVNLFEDVYSNQIYPNPAKDVLYLPSEASEIKIIDLTGQVIKEHTSTSFIKVDNLSNGQYIIEYKLNNQLKRSKFIKQ